MLTQSKSSVQMYKRPRLSQESSVDVYSNVKKTAGCFVNRIPP